MQGSNHHLSEAVLKTIGYFDGFEMPVTSFEIWYYLFSDRQYSYSTIQNELNSMAQDGRIETAGAFYTLPGKRNTIEQRMKRYFYAEEKFSIARRIVKIVRCIPYIRLVAVCNTLSFDMTRKEGDIDLFIVTKKGRLYFARALVTLFVHVLGFRRHGFSIQDRICLSFFVDEGGMDISRLALNGGDPYLASWTRQLVPMFVVGDTFKRLWKENREWLSSYFYFPQSYEPVPRRTVPDTAWSVLLRAFGELICNFFGMPLEIVMRYVQQIKMRHAKKRNLRVTPTAVVIDDHTLKFHEEDRREYYRSHMHKAVKGS